MRDNYERNENIPKAGFTAGPCLMKDTMQLSSFYNLFICHCEGAEGDRSNLLIITFLYHYEGTYTSSAGPEHRGRPLTLLINTSIKNTGVDNKYLLHIRLGSFTKRPSHSSFNLMIQLAGRSVVPA